MKFGMYCMREEQREKKKEKRVTCTQILLCFKKEKMERKHTVLQVYQAETD